MPKFKVVRKEYHQVVSIFTEEFDTKSQDQWDDLKDRADVDEDDYPEKPPKDPAEWLELFVSAREIDPDSRYDDWVSERKGGYDVSFEVIDSKGKVILEE
jgi:hypothetical protein